MAQNITLLGADYPDVPAVTLPITGGGTATFSDTRSVTYNLSGGASASVTPSEVVTGQGFSVKLTAPTGYNLNNVTVTMGGVDITSQVFTPDESGSGGGGGESWQETASESVIIISGSPNYFMISNYTTPFLSDETYRVTWGQGGTQYTCNTEAIGSPAYDGYCVGNKAIVGVGSDTGEPFFLYRSSTTQLVGGTTNAAGTIYIKIEKKVSGGCGSAVLISKSVTANGTYTASDDSADGYSDVTVNVANSYAAGDEGKVVSNGALVAQGSDTVTQNGTVDTTLISSLVVNVAAGGSSVKTGTVTPSAASTTISFDAGLSTITGILIMPINTPLTGSRTQAAMICLPNGSFYKAISIHTNSGGTGWVSPTVYTSNKFSLSGTTVTVTGAYSFRPAVGYVWYAW